MNRKEFIRLLSLASASGILLGGKSFVKPSEGKK